MDPLGRRHEHTGGEAPHKVSVTDTGYILVGPRLQCRVTPEIWFINHQLVTSYIVVLSPFSHVAHLDPKVPAHDALHLRAIPTKAESQWPAGEHYWAAFTSGSAMSRRMPMLYCCQCWGELRLPGLMEWRMVHSDYATMMRMMILQYVIRRN